MTRFVARAFLFSLLIIPALMDQARCQTLAAPLQDANPQFLDCRGVGNAPCPPLAGGKLTSYAAGTTTPLATCATTTLSGANCATPNANPVILNSYGYNAAGSGTTGIWPLPARCYKFKLTDSSNVVLWTIDNVCNQSGLLQASLVASTGAGLIGFSQTATYPSNTVGKKLQQYIVDSSGNAALGTAPLLPVLTTGTNNTGLGTGALAANTTGVNSVAVGHGALNAETTGGTDTAVGTDAGNVVTTGYDNTLIGYFAAPETTTGFRNIAVGAYSLQHNITGSSNTAVGGGALGWYDSTNSAAFGFEALSSLCSTGQPLMPVSGPCNNSQGNTGLGWEAGSTIENTPYNTAVGWEALAGTLVGTGNTAVGAQALSSFSGSTCGATCAVGDFNTIVGAFSFPQSAMTAAVTENTAMGYQAGNAATTAARNNLFGYRAGYALTTGGQNTLIGAQTGQAITVNSGNVLVGHQAATLATGDINVGVGTGVFGALTTGSGNTAIGNVAAPTLTTGSSNSFLGAATDVDDAAAVHRTVVGRGALGKIDNAVTLGLPTEKIIFGAPTGLVDTGLQNGQCTFLLTTNTNLEIRCKGSDGAVRAADLTLM